MNKKQKLIVKVYKNLYNIADYVSYKEVKSIGKKLGVKTLKAINDNFKHGQELSRKLKESE